MHHIDIIDNGKGRLRLLNVNDYIIVEFIENFIKANSRYHKVFLLITSKKFF